MSEQLIAWANARARYFRKRAADYTFTQEPTCAESCEADAATCDAIAALLDADGKLRDCLRDTEMRYVELHRIKVHLADTVHDLRHQLAADHKWTCFFLRECVHRYRRGE